MASWVNLAAFGLCLGRHLVGRVLRRRTGCHQAPKSILQTLIFQDFGTDFDQFVEHVSAFLIALFVCVLASFVCLCCLIFLYHVLSVLCERSAQASEASVAREAIKTHAHSQRFLPCLCFLFLCVSICSFACISFVLDHASVVFLICFRVSSNLHLITRFPFSCQSGLC